MDKHARKRMERKAGFFGLFLLPVLTGLSCVTESKTTPSPNQRPDAVSAPMPLSGKAYDAANAIQLPKQNPNDLPGLHNVFKLSRNIISGSEPHGEEAFQSMKEMGVKTILSVDGKAPDAEMAAKYGMKYVHVPIQYKGITDEEMTKIAKTFREQEGPFFVHCFHGKHRGPAAAEIGRLVIDGIPRQQAIAEMRQYCGTAPSYEGLYKTVAIGTIPSEGQTRSYEWDFPAAQPLKGYVEAMTVVSRADDNLRELAKHKWEAFAEHPDADALNEATKLAAALEKANQLEEVAKRPEDFRKWSTDAVSQSANFRETLKQYRAGKVKIEDVDKAFKAVSKTCSACHEVYRNE